MRYVPNYVFNGIVGLLGLLVRLWNVGIVSRVARTRFLVIVFMVEVLREAHVKQPKNKLTPALSRDDSLQHTDTDNSSHCPYLLSSKSTVKGTGLE